MRALSASTTVTDRYRAGVVLGEELSPLKPEVVFLFSSLQYGVDAELLEGLDDALETPGVVVVGNTGDGFYERGRVSNLGAAALALHSDGKVAWKVGSATGARADARGCTRTALARMKESAGGSSPAFGFMCADFRADGSLIEAVLQEETEAPFVGGLAADDYRFQRSSLFLGREVLEDAVVVLGAYGEVPFEIAVGNSLRAVGTAGRVSEAKGRSVRSIEGLSAMDFIQRETGKPALSSDMGIVTFSISDPQRPEVKRLRSVLPGVEVATGAVGLLGGIEQGQSVQVCLANPEDLVREVYDIAAHVRHLSPVAALVVSCAGRKETLGKHIEHEVRALSQAFPAGLPLAGFPSFGEFGPLREQGRLTRSFFHNMTYVVLLIGDAG